MIGSLQNIAPSVEDATEYDVNREVNNGRGPVDFKVSKGSKDTTLVEFKLASNTKLKKNLENQVEIYKKANCTDRAIKAILYFLFRLVASKITSSYLSRESIISL